MTRDALLDAFDRIGSATAQAVAKLQIAIRPLFSDECGLIREAAFSVEEYEP